MNARFTAEDADRAREEWGFNCGPGALCGVLGMTPEEIRPRLLDFEAKRYTNPTLMFAILRGLDVRHRQTYRGGRGGVPGRVAGVRIARVEGEFAEIDAAAYPDVWPEYGLVRIQWAGSWTNPAVPMAARYRHSHWIGVCRVAPRHIRVFDVNAMLDGGWLELAVWQGQLVPWLLKECEPKATGEWWPVNVIEVAKPQPK